MNTKEIAYILQKIQIQLEEKGTTPKTQLIKDIKQEEKVIYIHSPYAFMT
jgi:hypothetical protein